MSDAIDTEGKADLDAKVEQDRKRSAIKLVARFSQSEGYRLLSLRRACSVVKRQSAAA